MTFLLYLTLALVQASSVFIIEDKNHCLIDDILSLFRDR